MFIRVSKSLVINTDNIESFDLETGRITFVGRPDGITVSLEACEWIFALTEANNALVTEPATEPEAEPVTASAPDLSTSYSGGEGEPRPVQTLTPPPTSSKSAPPPIGYLPGIYAWNCANCLQYCTVVASGWKDPVLPGVVVTYFCPYCRHEHLAKDYHSCTDVPAAGWQAPGEIDLTPPPIPFFEPEY